MINTEHELIGQYNNLVNDIDFDRLELGLKQPNIFDILKITNNEIRHSNFLAWLLNPRESHGIGDLFIKRFLRELVSDNKIATLNEIEIEQLNYTGVDIKREWNNIDLLIEFDNTVICIENKVLSKDHSNQLKRYKNTVLTIYGGTKDCVFAYLTPYGGSSSEEQETYAFFSYMQITSIIDRIVELHGGSMNSAILQYLKDYSTILKRKLMQNDSLNVLANKIYRNHHEVLEFIFENRPDVKEILVNAIKNKVVNSGWNLGSPGKYYIRFYTSQVDSLIPRYEVSNGWTNKEGFLFEFDLYNPKHITFKSVIAPGNQAYRDTLFEIVSSLPGTKTPSGKKWIAQFLERKKFNFEKLPEMTEEEINEELNKYWPKVEAIVNLVTEAMLANATEIKASFS